MSRFSPFRFVAAPTGVLLLTLGVVLAPPVIAAANAQVVSAPATSTEFPVDSDRRVTADGTFLVRDALARLFRSGGESFVMSDLPAEEVSLSLRSVPFDTALKVILNASKTPLTYRREDGVYVIVPRNDPAPSDPAPSRSLSRATVPGLVSLSTPDAATAVVTALNLRIAEAEADLSALRTTGSGDAPQLREMEARLASLYRTLTEWERRAVAGFAASQERNAVMKQIEHLASRRASLLERGYVPTGDIVRRVDLQIAALEKQLAEQKQRIR